MSKENSSDKPKPGEADQTAEAAKGSKTPKNFADLSGDRNSDQDLPRSKVSRYVSFGLLLGIIALVAVLFYEVMASFLVPLFLAALLVVVFRPLHQWILNNCGGREKLSALLTTAAVLLTVLVPIGILLLMAAAEGRQVYGQFNSTRIVEGVRQIRTNLKLDMPAASEIRLIENELLDLQQNVALTDREQDRHRASLYEIQEAAKSIAIGQGLDWPADGGGFQPESTNDADDVEALDTANPQNQASDWNLFASNLLTAREIHNKMKWNEDENGNRDSARHQMLHQYQVHLNDTADYFSGFRTDLLGGKTKAWMIEMFNPSDTDTDAYATSVVAYLRDKLFKLGGAGVSYLGNLLLGSAIMIIGLYFFLLDGPKMIEGFKGLSPIDDTHEQELVAEFSRVSRAVVVATLLSALVQGLLAGVGFYFAGLESIFLLTVLSAVLAMVPFVGAAAVWIPCSLYLYFFDNNMTAAIGLAIFGVAVISMADNVIKPLILHGQSNLHPLLALLSVLGGVATLGPIGILVGPMVVAFLQTLLKILQREMTDLGQMDQERQTA